MYIPKQLWQGGKYLGDLEGFDVDFFRLLNSDKAIELRLDGRSDKSYYYIRANMVFIGTKQRVYESDWIKKAVIYHEYGHAIDFQRWLNQTKECKDAIEQYGSMRDTIKALTLIYGWGHDDDYFANPTARATEYIAHAFENAFIGNKQFKKLLPKIYDDMVDYIRQLKKMQ